MRRRISASTTPIRKISTTSMCRTSDFHQWYSWWFFHYLCYANELRPLIWVYWLDFHEPMIRFINCLPHQKPISVSHYIQFLILEEMTSWRILLLFTIYIIKSCPFSLVSAIYASILNFWLKLLKNGSSYNFDYYSFSSIVKTNCIFSPCSADSFEELGYYRTWWTIKNNNHPRKPSQNFDLHFSVQHTVDKTYCRP